MFSCVGSTSADNGNNDETIDKVLTEGIKLKRKCKSLRLMLMDTESKRKEESEQYEQQLTELRQQLDDYTEASAGVQSQHYIELAQLRDYRTHEVNELRQQLSAAREELSMQGPLIITMTHKISELENELEDQRSTFNAEWQALSTHKSSVHSHMTLTNQQLKDQTTDGDGMNKLKPHLQEEILLLQQQLEEVTAENNSLKRDNDTFQSTLDSLNREQQLSKQSTLKISMTEDSPSGKPPRSPAGGGFNCSSSGTRGSDKSRDSPAVALNSSGFGGGSGKSNCDNGSGGSYCGNGSGSGSSSRGGSSIIATLEESSLFRRLRDRGKQASKQTSKQGSPWGFLL